MNTRGPTHTFVHRMYFQHIYLSVPFVNRGTSSRAVDGLQLAGGGVLFDTLIIVNNRERRIIFNCPLFPPEKLEFPHGHEMFPACCMQTSAPFHVLPRRQLARVKLGTLQNLRVEDSHDSCPLGKLCGSRFVWVGRVDEGGEGRPENWQWAGKE